MEHYNVIIIGGGASGLACAVALSERKDIKILVVDAGARAGKKLSATGNGQGNIFNTDCDISHYRGGNSEIIKKIVYPKHSACDWACNRIFGAMLYKQGSMGRAYPQSMQASSLTDILLNRLCDRGAELLLSTRVLNIEKKGEVFIVDCGEKLFSADFVVLATGGKAQKQFCTDGSSYKLAERFGHKLTALYPSVVQLKTDVGFIKNLKGVRANCAVTAIVGEKPVKTVVADVIFTEYGISGNATFYLSSVLTAGGGKVSIDFLPDYTCNRVASVLCARRADGIGDENLFSGILHNQIARAVIRRAPSSNIADLVETAKKFTLDVKGTLGFDYAQVTQGGIDMSDIDSDLGSKLCKNLYFAGEILDVDGDCGGYNLHWAFASGITVADAISVRYEKA